MSACVDHPPKRVKPRFKPVCRFTPGSMRGSVENSGVDPSPPFFLPGSPSRSSSLSRHQPQLVSPIARTLPDQALLPACLEVEKLFGEYGITVWDEYGITSPKSVAKFSGTLHRKAQNAWLAMMSRDSIVRQVYSCFAYLFLHSLEIHRANRICHSPHI